MKNRPGFGPFLFKMKNWLDSVYSDGSSMFLSDPAPSIGDKITVSLRLLSGSPVKKIFIRTEPNGGFYLTEMKFDRTEDGLDYYTAPLEINEKEIRYHFYLVTDDKIYFYNQNGITTIKPDFTYDFKIETDYVQPEWVKRSVFYQIFPERFYNGNSENDPKDGEYFINGHPVIKRENWEDTPLDYEEGFCLDFHGGDLEGIKEKIPYLKELGVNALYLNPIFLAPTVHKYDCIDYETVDPHFGGEQALIELSEELHKNDMKFILDISLNHTGSNHKWFNKDASFYDKSTGAYNNPNAKERDYYFFKDDSYRSWWNIPEMPELNFTSEALREKTYKGKDSILRKWIKAPFKSDGWRFDVADTFLRNDEIQLDKELWPEIRKAIRDENDQAYILAEDWEDSSDYLQGDMWDSPMNYFGCAKVLREFVGQQDLFFQMHEDLKDIPYRISAEELRERIEMNFAKIPFALQQNQFNLIDSHDVARLHVDPDVNEDDYKGAVILQFTLIGTPSVYYGDEAGIGGTSNRNEGSRFPMPWSTNFKKKEIYKFYKKLIHIRRNSKALTEGGMKFLYAKGDVVALSRFFGKEKVLAVFSRSNKEEKVIIPIGIIGAQELNQDNDMLGTPLKYRNLEAGEIEITLKPHQALLIDLTEKT